MTNANTKTVQLQSVGHVAAKPAKEFKVGDFMAWNFGFTSEVVGIAKETKAFIVFELKSTSDGITRERRLKKDRLVAIAKA